MKRLMKVEIPFGCQLKYEEDKDTGLMVATRVVPEIYPAIYGYIPNTLAEDNDPLDVFLVDSFVHYRDIYPGVLINVEILGMIKFIDDGEVDNKLIAKIAGTTLDHPQVRQIQNFLKKYKPESVVEVGDFVDENEAIKYLEFCEEQYEKEHRF